MESVNKGVERTGESRPLTPDVRSAKLLYVVSNALI